VRHANIAVFVPHAGCPHTCSFCNQKTISGCSAQPTAADVTQTIENALSYLGNRAKDAEIAFFGGSFTAIDRQYMISLLEAAKPYIDSGRLYGIRCSTRPDCIDEEVLELLKSYSVTSIELGAQSMSDRVLRLNERGHRAQDVVKAAQLVRQYGFELGLQMMTGLYGDDDEGAVYTAQEIAKLGPDTVRIYPTVVLRGTKLAELYVNGEYRPQPLEGAVGICAALLRFFYERGIDVIKLGLHAEDGVERDYLAGAYHPALRELAEGRIYLDEAERQIKEKGISGRITVLCPKGEISKVVGQHRCNILRLSQLGCDAKVSAREGIGKYSLEIISEQK